MNALIVTYPGAILAGVLSFASPCILPLVPAYLSFLGGASLETIASERPDPAVTGSVLTSALCFVAGFVAVFVVLGASATLFGRVLAEHLDLWAKAAGVLVILFGLHYAGLLRLRFLNYELRFHPAKQRAGALGAFAIGLSFGFGWTPCVGPVLATILALASQQPSIRQGVALLICYGAGLGIPFLAAAAAIRPFLRLVGRARRHMRWVELALGSMMIFTGVLILAGSVADVSGWLMRTFPALSRIG